MNKLKSFLKWLGAVMIGAVGFTVIIFLLMGLQNLIVLN